MVKLEIKINGELAEPLSLVCHRDAAYRTGRALVSKLKELIPRQMFRVPIQACVGVKVGDITAILMVKAPFLTNDHLVTMLFTCCQPVRFHVYPR